MELVFLCAALSLSWWGTGMLQRHVAERLGMIDRPNERSSHTIPTPRGGGLAIVAVSLSLCLLLWQQGLLPPAFAMAVVGGGAAVALIGFWDDRRHVPAARRLLVHGGAALWAIYWLDGLPAIDVGRETIVLPAWGAVLAVFFLVWLVNLYNFMDGIDGLAGVEAVTVFLGAAAILHAVGTGADLSLLFAFAGAVVGFLRWNWPPAKIFMGDAGSGFLGFVLGICALYWPMHSRMSLWSWVILLGVFLVDATVTLLVRAFRGERLHMAHRSHAYQRLARKFQSHQKVTVGVLVINTCWLFPLALGAAFRPAHGVWLTALALTPLVTLCLWAGAGKRAEERTI